MVNKHMKIKTTHTHTHTHTHTVKSAGSAIRKKCKISNVHEDVEEKLESLYTAVRNVKWCSCFGKQFRNPQKVKHRVVI